MAKNSVRTSREVASKAAKVLKEKRAGKVTKQLAGSALSNRRPK